MTLIQHQFLVSKMMMINNFGGRRGNRGRDRREGQPLITSGDVLATGNVFATGNVYRVGGTEMAVLLEVDKLQRLQPHLI